MGNCKQFCLHCTVYHKLVSTAEVARALIAPDVTLRLQAPPSPIVSVSDVGQFQPDITRQVSYKLKTF